jgi:predicted lipoprotein with Yx(FWY)xxD motif
MSETAIERSPRGKSGSRAMKLSVTALAAAGLLVVPFIDSAGASTSVLQSVNVTGFPGVLANHASRTLYVLTVEKGAKLKCEGACLANWIPVTVKSSVTSVNLGANVKGKIGFVARSATTKQVTFNSYPVYTFAGDTGARQSHGEGLAFDGGKWYVAKAASTSAGATPILKAATSGGSGTATNTTGGGGGGTTTATTPGGGGGGATTTTTPGGGIAY